MSATKTYGFRIDRAGGVYAYLSPARHGRLPEHMQKYVGQVRREGRAWRNDQASDRWPTQEAAARSLVQIVMG